MDNKVGDHVPSVKAVADLVQQLKDILDKLKSFGVILSDDERKRLLHARREADPMVKRVHDLAVKYGVAIPSIPLQDMINDMTLRERVHPIADVVRATLTVVVDTEAEAESEMWQAFLAYYGVLSSMSGRLPDLASELETVTTFMSNPRRRKAPAPPDGNTGGGGKAPG
jgi:hypothetical protein